MNNLYEVEINKKYNIEEMPNSSLLKSLGVFIGAEVYKKNTYSMGGPVLIMIENREVAIGKDLAIFIMVSEVNGNV